MSLLEEEDMMLTLCLTGFSFAEAGKNASTTSCNSFLNLTISSLILIIFGKNIIYYNI